MKAKDCERCTEVDETVVPVCLALIVCFSGAYFKKEYLPNNSGTFTFIFQI